MSRQGSAGRVVLALAPLACALALLLPRLDWGFLSTAPGVPVVHTAQPDERHLAEGLLRMSWSPLSLDARDRSWGGLSFTLLFVLVTLVDAAGVFPGGWKAALLSGDLARAGPVLLTFRTLSVLAVLASACAAYVLARRRRGAGAGFLAASLVALSPAMALSGRAFVTDALETALVVLAFVPASPVASGLLLGLAIGTKYSAAAFLPALALAVPAGRRRALLWAVPLGFTFGAPFVVGHPHSSAKLLLFHLMGIHGLTGTSFGAFLGMWRWHATVAALYLAGPVALAFGLAALARRASGASGGARSLVREPGIAVPAFLVAGQLAWLAASNFPVVRYQLPLVPFLAAWAAEGLAEIRAPLTRTACAGLALAAPAALSFLLVFGVPRTHPFESAGALLRSEVRGGERVGRVWFGMPQLPGVPTEELKAFPSPVVPPEPPSQDFLVDDDLPPIPFAPEYVTGRQRDYTALATFGGEPGLFGVTWPRALTPHDARYSSPRVTVWEKTSRSARPPAPAP